MSTPSASAAAAGSTLTAIRHRLQEISTAASTAAEALDPARARVDFLAPEVGRVLGRLDVVSERLACVLELLALGVDPRPTGDVIGQAGSEAEAEGRRG